MKAKVLILVLIGLLFPVLAFGASFTLTVDDTAAGISLPTACTDKTHLFAVLETAQIRFWHDGTVPSSTVGIPLQVGQTIDLYGMEKLRGFKAIRTGTTSGVLSGDCE